MQTRRIASLLRSLLSLLPLLAAAALPAQTTCFDTGSVPIAASILTSPLPLGCSAAPTWPMWHLCSPAYRAIAPHPGFAPGDARVLAVWLIPWRCTGHLLPPVAPLRIRSMGFVLDTPESRCPQLSR